MKMHLSYDLLLAAIKNAEPIHKKEGMKEGIIRVYGVPRGGIFAALLFGMVHRGVSFIEDPEYADLIVDDIIDTGATARRYSPNTPFFAIIGRKDTEYPPNVIVGNRVPKDMWMVFPWEAGEEQRVADDTIVGTLRNRLRVEKVPFLANDNISTHISPAELRLLQTEVEYRVQHLLDALLIDTDSDHNTRDTSKRVAKMFMQESFYGRFHPMPKLTSFPNAKALDELYTTGPITVRSTCSHHLAPIHGKCWIGVVPGDRVIGLSKFNRLVDWVMSRPQIQEEAAVMLADLFETLIQPKGLAVVIKATHMCMTHRGVREHPDAIMTTSVMRGVLRDKPEARAEFLELIK